MTVGERRALSNFARSLGVSSPSRLEAALLTLRSAKGADVLAGIIDDNTDTAEISRIARRVVAGDRRARDAFSSFSPARLAGMARVLCLSGDDESFDRGIDVLRGLAMAPGLTALNPRYRSLLAEALIFRHRFEEAADLVAEDWFEGAQRLQFELGIRNPFREGNPLAVPVPEWLELFNDYVSPSHELSPITLDSRRHGLPFDQLRSHPVRTVDGPLVTVVMSSFRSDGTILGAVQSILDQTWRSLELLVIDDDSGPEYDELYDRIAALDPRIRIIRQRINGGTYLIRNRALTLARGDYITFQDSDDWSHPERIERQMEAMLADRKAMSTQSFCFRTDDSLTPIQVGYLRRVRRNESSLLIRAEAVRRAGFFHYTRKGGDSEFRLRLEAAYGRPTIMVGTEPLAIVRLVPGSLSRNEFSPGFRHPARLIYSQAYNLVHDRARDEGFFHRSLHEYADPFVPARFQPRRPDTAAAKFDVIVAADLRVCARMEAWITATVNELRTQGLRVGLAQYSGLYRAMDGVDRLSHEVTALFVDGVAEPVMFGDQHRAAAVIVADAALLEHTPWGAGAWEADRVYVRRPVDTTEQGETFDGATVAFTSRRLFGTRPTWTAADDDDMMLREIVSVSKTPSQPVEAAGFDVHVLHAGFGETDGSPPPAGHHWWARVDLAAAAKAETPLDDIAASSPGVPFSFARADDGRWCAIAGWPIIGFDLGVARADTAAALLRAWRCGAPEFEEKYADVGGDCLVLRGDHGDTAVRATARPFAVELTDDVVEVRVTDEASGPLTVGGNQDELVLTSAGTTHHNPISASIDYDGTPLEEFQQLIGWEVDAGAVTDRRISLDDDVDSALRIGLLRDHIEDFEFSVRAPGSRVARFLDAHFIDYRISPRSRPLAGAFDESEVTGAQDGPRAETIADRLCGLGTSRRARAFDRLVRDAMDLPVVLDELWPGLSSVPEPVAAQIDADADADPASTATWTTMPDESSCLVPGVLDARALATLPLQGPGAVHRIGIAPDLALNESFPLSGTLLTGKSDRLVVTLASEREKSDDGYPVPPTSAKVISDHHLVAVDTTFGDDRALDFGWFFGVPGDDLVRRWATLTSGLIRRLNCRDVVVRGSRRSALPAVLLSSYLPGATVLVDGLEAVAGDANPEQFSRLTDLIGHGYSPDRLRAAYRQRLCLDEILTASSTDLHIVLTDAVKGGDEATGVGTARSRAGTRMEPRGADYWLGASDNRSA